jgi:hypothetical protein
LLEVYSNPFMSDMIARVVGDLQVERALGCGKWWLVVVVLISTELVLYRYRIDLLSGIRAARQ